MGGGWRDRGQGGGWEGWKQRRVAAKNIDRWGSGREANKEAMKKANSEVYLLLFFKRGWGEWGKQGRNKNKAISEICIYTISFSKGWGGGGGRVAGPTGKK